MDARGHEIERDHRNSSQYPLDEGLAPRANPGGGGSVNAVKKLRGGNGSERDLYLSVIRDDVVPIETTTLGGNQHAGIDQRRHGDFGSLG